MRSLQKIKEDLEGIEDELRVDYDLTGWASRLRRMINEIDRKIELQERIFDLPAGRYDFSALVRRLTRDRTNSKAMKQALVMGHTHFKRKMIMGSENEPYIQRWSRKEVKAELTFDKDRQLGGKPEKEAARRKPLKSSQSG